MWVERQAVPDRLPSRVGLSEFLKHGTSRRRRRHCTVIGAAISQLFLAKYGWSEIETPDFDFSIKMLYILVDF